MKYDYVMLLEDADYIRNLDANIRIGAALAQAANIIRPTGRDTGRNIYILTALRACSLYHKSNRLPNESMLKRILVQPATPDMAEMADDANEYLRDTIIQACKYWKQWNYWIKNQDALERMYKSSLVRPVDSEGLRLVFSPIRFEQAYNRLWRCEINQRAPRWDAVDFPDNTPEVVYTSPNDNTPTVEEKKLIKRIKKTKPEDNIYAAAGKPVIIDRETYGRVRTGGSWGKKPGGDLNGICLVAGRYAEPNTLIQERHIHYDWPSSLSITSTVEVYEWDEKTNTETQITSLVVRNC